MSDKPKQVVPPERHPRWSALKTSAAAMVAMVQTMHTATEGQRDYEAMGEETEAGAGESKRALSLVQLKATAIRQQLAVGRNELTRMAAKETAYATLFALWHISLENAVKRANGLNPTRDNKHTIVFLEFKISMENGAGELTQLFALNADGQVVELSRDAQWYIETALNKAGLEVLYALHIERWDKDQIWALPF